MVQYGNHPDLAGDPLLTERSQLSAQYEICQKYPQQERKTRQLIHRPFQNGESFFLHTIEAPRI
jgi:hypothetical protein